MMTLGYNTTAAVAVVVTIAILFESMTQANVFSLLILQTEFTVTVENIETLLIGMFSIVLLFLSITSYRKTRLKNIKYAAVAFGLFAFDVLVELIMEKYYVGNYPMLDLLHTSITLAILGLFFLAIVKKRT